MDSDIEDTELDTGKEDKSSDTTGSSCTISYCGISATETSTTSETLISELDTQKRRERYADEIGDSRYASKKSYKSDSTDEYSLLETETINLREEAISETISSIQNSLQVDLCFVLDCTGSMSSYIDAAKDCILKVVNHMEDTNPNIKLWVGFCGYRDHCDSDRLITYDFTDSYSRFRSYVGNVRVTGGGGDGPEDVLGGLDVAVKKMKWSHRTRILLHMGDYPPHGRRFDNRNGDSHPDGDPYGLTAESVLGEIQSAEILYYFGKITTHTDKMLQIFRDIIGEFPVFNLDTDGKDPEVLTKKLFEAVCSSITSSVTITSAGENVYERLRKNLEIDESEPDWNTLPTQTGKLLHYLPLKTLADVKDRKYFKKSNLILRKISYKQAPKPFSSGAERYAYFALDVTGNKPDEEIIIKECIEHGRKANSLERYLEMIEVSTVAHFLSKEFNTAAKEVGLKKKVKFLKSQALRNKDGSDTRCYSIEPKIKGLYKRFNVNRGVIKEYHSTLEAFAHFTYKYTEGYLVVYDLQGLESSSQFLLTDPAIHCKDRLRFGRTNLGNRGINTCFLANHKCGNVCEKLGLPKVGRT